MQVNGSKTILRRGEHDPDVITKEYLLQKAQEHTLLSELLQTQIIKKAIFIHVPNQTIALTIETTKKKKDKKKKKSTSTECDDKKSEEI